jgi:hypothetical protein
MSEYLITSREGLFLFNISTQEFCKLREGYFFGLARHRDLWYVFGYKGNNVNEKNYPTFKGYIASFHLSNGQVEGWTEQYINLDNGSHQLRVYRNKLYLVETYIQSIAIFNIMSDGSLVHEKNVHMFSSPKSVVNAHYVINGTDQYTTCQGYKHINALTFHDGLIYLSCPSLRNHINQEGVPTQGLSPHVIEVYDVDFNFLWSYILQDEVFCHDIVFQGHKMYMNAPPNKVCVFDIVDKTITSKITMSVKAFHPRGLSISRDGLVVVGFRRPGMLAYFHHNNVNAKHDIKYIVSPCEPCFISMVDYENDYNNMDSALVKGFVKQVHQSMLPLTLNIFDQICDLVFDNDWTKYKDTRWEQEKTLKISQQEYNLQEVKEPSDEVFTDLHNLQKTSSMKIHIAKLVVRDELQIKHHEILKLLDDLEQYVQKRALRVSGHLYLYPAQSALGWHTNLEEIYNHNTIRCYVVHTTRDNETFFLYKHPVSNLIHAVPDRNKFANIFALGNEDSPLWHAVYNNSKDTMRLSLGLAFHQYRLGAFHPMKAAVEEIIR